ncbi:VapE domain-containing protein [Roseateles sp. DB2]
MKSTVDNSEASAMTHVISLANLQGMATAYIPSYVAAIADEYQINPVADWICSMEWDGEDRLPALAATLVTADHFCLDLKLVILRKWLLSAVAAALSTKGFRCRGVLTLQGRQGIGKTSWFSSLVPAKFREDFVRVDHQMDPTNKDSVLGAITHWITEFGELETSLRRAELGRLKGFITRDSDKVRRPYGRSESEYPRRTVFCASVNDANFLIDHTGNTRWWTIPVVSVDARHSVDMQQVYAQLKVSFEAGEKWWLTEDEEHQLEEFNQAHKSVSAMREKLLELIDSNPLPYTLKERMTTPMLLRKLGYKQPRDRDFKEMTAILKELFGDGTKSNGYMCWNLAIRSNPGTPEALLDMDERY